MRRENALKGSCFQSRKEVDLRILIKGKKKRNRAARVRLCSCLVYARKRGNFLCPHYRNSKLSFLENVLLRLTVPMVVFSLLVPQPFVWMGQSISALTFPASRSCKINFPSFGFVATCSWCVIMFGVRMTLKADDFEYSLQKADVDGALIGICSQYVFMAGFGWLVASSRRPSRVWVTPPFVQQISPSASFCSGLRARRHRVKRHDVPCEG